jgi:hypothetical protein
MAKRKKPTSPEPYQPRALVQGDKLPRRYKDSPTTRRLLAQAARRATLAAVYFGEDN